MWTRLRPYRGPLVGNFPNLTDAPLVIRGYVFYPTGPDQIAIDLRWPEADSCVNTTVIIRDCHFVPRDTFHWGLTCIRLTNGWNAVIESCNFVGPSGKPEPLTVHGWILDGQSTGVTVQNNRGSGLGAFGYIKGECEGTRVLYNDAIGCRYGLVAWTDSGGYEPGLWAIGNHFNSTVAGMHFRRRYQVVARDNLLYAGNYFTGTKHQPYTGMLLEDCRAVVTDNCKVTPNGTGEHAKPSDLIVPFRATDCEDCEGRAVMASW